MIGKTISHYNIIEKLGSGGMGDVFKAEDTKLKRTVAVKFLPKDLTRDEEAKKRFLHEAQAASALDHKNIGGIFEIDETEDGQMFLAMAYYKGESLKERIERGPLPLKDSVTVAIQIAQGMAKAHAKGVVHRDIKPANILITEDQEVKIIDFGLAKLTGQTKLTKAGTTLGTVAYMSPQQAQGGVVDHRTDIWALGVVLYEAVTGQLAFHSEYEHAMMYSIMNEDPEPISGLRTGVPLELERIVNKAIAKNPEERYQHMDDMLVDLKSLIRELESGTTTTRPAVAGTQKPRRSFLISGIALLAALLVLAGILFYRAPEHALTRPSIAVLPFTDMSPQQDQEFFCDGMTEEILTKLSQLGDLKVIARTSVMRFKNTDKSIKEIGKTLGVATLLEGSIRREDDNIRVTAQLINVEDESHLWAETFDQKLASVFQLQEELSKAIAKALQPKLAPNKSVEFTATQPKNVEAYEYYLKGMYQLNRRYLISELERNLQNALDMFDKAIAIDPNYSLAYVGRGKAYQLQWDGSGYQDRTAFGQMKENYQRALKLDPNSAEALAAIGTVHAIENNFDEAYQSIKTSLRLNPNVTETNFMAGMLLRNRGLFQQSIRGFSKAKEIDPFLVSAYTNLAQDLIYVGKFDEASILLEKAKELEPEFVPIHAMEVQIAIIMKKYDQAEAIISQAEKIHPERIATEKALLLAARGEKEKALALTNHPFFYSVIGEVYALLGMKDKAIESIMNENKQDRSHYYYLNLISNPLLRSLKDDPAFQKFVEDQKMKHEEYLRRYGDLVAG